MRCPACASSNVAANVNGWVDCHYCNKMGSADEFGCEWVEVTDGTTLPGDKFSYIPDPDTGVGRITSHKRLAPRI